MTHANRATKYARRVVSGEILACLLVKQACQRHLDWMDRDEYDWDEDAANKVCRFIELLPHTKGEWARRRELLKLEDWQCFVVGVPFGWVRKSDGLRVFRRVYVEVPRKNAKSTLTAALGLYMLTSDGEHGAEVYSGAGSEKQAWEVFRPARLMAKNTPDLTEAFSLEINAKNLNVLDTASRFEPIIGKPGDGASPSFSVTDEYHEHKTDEQYDTMVTGMGARTQPIAWVITTAGDDTAGPCYALRGECVSMLNNSIENDTLFGIIYTVDEDTDWTAEEALITANPNIGVSVSRDFLLQAQKEAVDNPRKQSTFKKKHLDVWVTAASPFFNLEKWIRLGDPELKMEDFLSEPCWTGIDLASKLDITATGHLFQREIDGEDHFYWFPRFYLPDERIDGAEFGHYRQWYEQGHLLTTPGNITDYDYLEADLKEDFEKHRVVQLGFDPYNATQMATHLIDHGMECVEVPQTVAHLSDPMKWIQGLIEDGRIHHNGNPAMSWQIGNVTAQIDRNDNVFPRKEHAHNKIDGAIALIIAKGRYLESEPSVYETGGSLWL